MNKTIIFDLDGTILDTLEDLNTSLNHVLSLFNYNEVSIDKTKALVGNGIRNLIKDAAGNPKELDSMYDEFIKYYEINYANYTKTYDGIYDVISELKYKGYNIVLFTNKNVKIAKKLIAKFYNNLFDYIIGDGMNIKRKPDSDGINIIKAKYNIDYNDILLIGDSDTDIKTIMNAGIKGIIVSYGFKEKEYLKNIWNGIIVDTPYEILSAIDNVFAS